MSMQFDFHQIDEVIHGRVRLGVIAFLVAAGTAEFTGLRQRLEVTEGTLSVHLRKLEEAGYVTIEKTFKGRRPLTRIHLTGEGREAFRSYLATMETLIDGPRRG